MPNISVSDIRTLFQLSKDVDSVEDDLMFMWLTAINTEAYKMLYTADVDKYATTAAVSVVDGTSSYSLPSDFKTIDATKCGLFEITDGIIKKEFDYTSFGSSDSGFYFDASNIVMTPPPTEDKSLTLRYVPSISNISSNDDLLIIPEGYEDLVVSEIMAKYDTREEEFDLVSVSQQFAENFKSRLLSNVKKYTPKTLRIRT